MAVNVLFTPSCPIYCHEARVSYPLEWPTKSPSAARSLFSRVDVLSVHYTRKSTGTGGPASFPCTLFKCPLNHFCTVHAFSHTHGNFQGAVLPPGSVSVAGFALCPAAAGLRVVSSFPHPHPCPVTKRIVCFLHRRLWIRSTADRTHRLVV